MLLNITSLVAGFVLLIKGADWLVDGASSLARRMGLSDLVIGLTVVSFGTSMPELIVNVIASFKGSADIAIGNVVGSNISNILLILGVTAIIAPLKVQKSTVLKEIPFGLLAAVTLFIMSNDVLIDNGTVSQLSRGDGLVFLSFFLIFLYYTFGMAGDSGKKTKAKQSLVKAWTLLIVGVVCLSLGGSMAVNGAQNLAIQLGISEALVGLTIVALGTSLPELAASIVAARKGKADIAVGNIAGSNIFNIFWILGLSATIKPLPFSEAVNFDLLVAVGCTGLLFFLIHNGGMHHRLLLWWRQAKDYCLGRWEGALLLTSYIAYIAFITWRDIGM